MDEDRIKVARAYRRATIGLAAGAIVWVAALLATDTARDEKARWLIPACCAILSYFFFTLYKRYRQ